MTDSERARQSVFSRDAAVSVILSNAKDLSEKRFFGVPPQNDSHLRSG